MMTLGGNNEWGHRKPLHSGGFWGTAPDHTGPLGCCQVSVSVRAAAIREEEVPLALVLESLGSGVQGQRGLPAHHGWALLSPCAQCLFSPKAAHLCLLPTRGLSRCSDVSFDPMFPGTSRSTRWDGLGLWALARARVSPSCRVPS